MLKVHTEKLGDVALLHFQGRIVAGAETATFRSAVFSQADASIMVLDLSRVDVVDACGLGTFLELREWTQTNGKEFRLFNPTRHVQQVFAITHLNSVFNISFGEDMQIRGTETAEKLTCVPECASQLGETSRRVDGRRAQEAPVRQVNMIGPTRVPAPSPTAKWEAAAPV